MSDPNVAWLSWRRMPSVFQASDLIVMVSALQSKGSRPASTSRSRESCSGAACWASLPGPAYS